ncbi:MAG: M23 family metallopeptidase [Bacteroidales bacterium]|nr:M23 family metallopeptidase [Bacteroidales bacterium]
MKFLPFVYKSNAMSDDQHNDTQKERRGFKAVASWFHEVGHFFSNLWSKRDIISREFKHKQRFVMMDTVTYKEKWSFQLSAINLFVTIGISIIVLVLVTSLIIAFTPLREFIPGYANPRMVEQTYQNSRTVDSLEHVLAQQEAMMADLRDIMTGQDPDKRLHPAKSNAQNNDKKADTKEQEYKPSKADEELRKEVEEQDRYVVMRKKETSSQPTQATQAVENNNTPSILLFTPIKGKVISPYDVKTRHYGVDIAGAENDAVKSVAPGTVIFANFTIETGNVIAVQHHGGIISVYKHNSTLLKHEGDIVRAGEPIAYLGNSGELTTGPHLHFELWIGGKPVNPLIYTSF